MGLRVTNRTDDELVFQPRGVEFHHTGMRATDGHPLRLDGGRDHLIAAPAVRLQPGESVVFVVRGELRWFRGQLRLRGVIGSGDMHWCFDPLSPGSYRVSFDYRSEWPPGLRPEGYWGGWMRTPETEFELGR
jgi:hypothetical protein